MVTSIHDPACGESPARDEPEGSEVRAEADLTKISRLNSRESLEDGQMEKRTSEKVFAYIDCEVIAC
jgi:hypothetical protein